MNHLFVIVLWIVVTGDHRLSIFVTNVSCRRQELSAVSFSLHAQRLYRRVRTDDSPYETNDSATFDEDLRDCICRDITRSGFIRSLHLVSVDKETIRRYRRKRRYTKIFEYLYPELEPGSLDSAYAYTNSFRSEIFLISSAYWAQEYVFICPVQHSLIFDVDPLYVSKEYNVNASFDSNGVYKPGRFIVGFIPAISGGSSFDFLMLAEEPAKAYTEFVGDANVEFHYLRIRKYVKPAESNDMDPLCKLISVDNRDPDNQHHRFCVAVSTSSHFIDKIEYVRRTEVEPCSEERISFKTAVAISAEASGKLFYERMVRCHFMEAKFSNIFKFFYISRAYASNQVLVYTSDPTDSRIYINNLSTNISILDELNSFDFVEQ